MAESMAAREEHCTQLREELKTWERDFSSNNDGRKPGRADIREHPDIASKYKDYNKLRDIISGKVVPPEHVKPSKKRKSGDDCPLTPSKRPKTVQATPRRREDSKSQVEQVDNKVEEELIEATPALKRTMMGPTPQRDGIMIGLFENMPTDTPSRPRTVLGNVDANIERTPSKGNWLLAVGSSNATFETPRHMKTPTTVSRKAFMDQFLTPSRKKTDNEALPSSKKLDATPAFLKRDVFIFSTLEEAPQSPEVRKPWKPRQFGRSLSGKIRQLREEEDKQADDEWDAMLEMENDEVEANTSKAPKIVVEDSQHVVMLDAEGFVLSDGEDAEGEVLPQLDRNGQPRKAYKKKGLKRQTRRVIMRPVLPKVQEASKEAEQSEPETETEEMVGETRNVPQSEPTENNVQNFDNESDAFSDHADVASAADEELRTSSKSSKISKSKSKKSKEHSSKATKPSKKRAIKPEAHANYVKLKIKNQNGKGNKGKGKFGRKNR
ncbi:hypothetical protein EJ08DRAFT_655737 [Tothia fuscella]|uniref:DNA replication regulator SLD2 n=1 Tax=Tothia fuscella TaxID=1048955 RepID=A0A9P4P2F2_9PEZI|nr:hypothetical protein EJ08DRAFT_655737 [Tothia fuscella]